MGHTRFTVLSNGHGEDTIGASVLQALRQETGTFSFQAFPTVGNGSAYENLNIPILGPRRVMPSEGFLFHHPKLFVGDLKAGFVGMSLQQVRELRALKTEALLVIGDIYALALSLLVKTTHRFYLQSLVSAYHSENKAPLELLRYPNRFFMERFSLPERLLLRRAVSHTYVRDAPTESLLRRLGITNVSALGNPMLDSVLHGDSARLPQAPRPPVIALLPGTRAHAPTSLSLMLRALARWPEATGLVAWAGGDLTSEWPPGWHNLEQAGCKALLARGEQRVLVLEGQFADVLAAADLVLGTAGTAHEQAASLGLPIVAFPVPPLYTAAYLRNQQRLLGEALTPVDATPEAIAAALEALWQDKTRYDCAAQAGRERMGQPGGSRAIANDILWRLGVDANSKVTSSKSC